MVLTRDNGLTQKIDPGPFARSSAWISKTSVFQISLAESFFLHKSM